MTEAATIATEIAQAEVDAVVAAGAAQVAVAAADAAIVMAEVQTAEVMQIAAAEIQQAEHAIAENEESVEWLKEKTQTLEVQLLQTVAMVETLQAQISELTASIQLQASLSQNLPPPEDLMAATLPENAVAQPEAAPENPNPPPAKKLLKRL